MYISPEMIAGSHSFSTDVWSLGVVFYILLSGVYPFESPSGDVEETKKIVSRGEFSFPVENWSDVSLPAQDLVRRMLIVDPQRRLTMAGVLKHPWMSNQKMKEV
jgi:serine/threonine protein kinase